MLYVICIRSSFSITWALLVDTAHVVYITNYTVTDVHLFSGIHYILHENLRRIGWLCFTSHRQRGHLETAPPFTVPCEGR